MSGFDGTPSSSVGENKRMPQFAASRVRTSFWTISESLGHGLCLERCFVTNPSGFDRWSGGYE